MEADTKEGHGVDGIANLRQFEEQHGKLQEPRWLARYAGGLR
jgi:hypothetical protein